MKFSCVLENPVRTWRCQHQLHMMTETLLRPRQFKESDEVPLAFEVHSKWPLHSASLVLKKVTAPEREVGSCHVPLCHLGQAGFVQIRLNEFKVARFGWHVSWWLAALIANIGGGCQVGHVFVRAACEEWVLLRARRCAGQPLFWQACFEYQSFSGNMEMCGTRTGGLTHTHLHTTCFTPSSAAVLTHTDSHYVAKVILIVSWVTVSLLLCAKQQRNWFSK